MSRAAAGGIESDVAIVGAGLMGAWTAYFLRRAGRSVVLLDKGDAGAQSSGVNFGNLRLQGRFPGQYPLALRAQAIWEQSDRLFAESFEFERCGHLYLAFDQEQADKLQRNAEAAAPHGLQLELLEPAALRRRWPWLSRQVVAGSFSARDATANPRLATPVVARAARALGARVLERTRVAEIEPAGARFRLDCEGGVTVEAAQLVNCAGAWGGEIAARFGEPVPLFAAGPPQFVTEPLPWFMEPSLQRVDGRVICRQVRRGNVVVAGYPRGASDPVANRAPVAPARTLATMRHLAELVPALAGCQVIRVWSGIEGYLPDMLPVIGPSATTPGLFHAFGFCGHGFQLGPGVGAVLSELLVEGRTATPIEPFAIGRFATALQPDDERLRAEFDPALLRSRPGA